MSHAKHWQLDLGARPLGDRAARFRVWAPCARTVAVRLMEPAGKPFQRAAIPLEARERGYFEATVPGVDPGSRYRYVLDGERERADPASRCQPDGVHGPSQLVDPDAFPWTDHGWSGLPLEDLILYELHTGTFTPEGTFPAIIPYLEYLRNELGVTAVELMPLAQFPGTRNWGYDGVYPFAPQFSYGGPDGLKALVDACHTKGLAVVLDVVYNHLGPEGNYLGDFATYFTDRYRTPWGPAINFDGPDSDEVRHYFISNALYWVTEYHVDALRLDAIHGIYDFSVRHILEELTETVHAEAARLGRRVLVMAESDLNDVRVIAPPAEGGYGLDAQWNDDFHHALHAPLTGEQFGYYQDFGRLDQLATALREGYVYSGRHSAYRRRRHGNSSRGRPPRQFVVCAQNHDQVGNRAKGERLSALIPSEALKVAAATVLLAPSVPLLFMGEEYGETAPFLYFTDHGDPALVEAVRRGRRAEFASFGWQGMVPDPQDPRTFERSRLNLGDRLAPGHKSLLGWYRRLIALRKQWPALGTARSEAYGCQAWTYEAERVLVVHRWKTGERAALLLLGFSDLPRTIALREPKGTWDLCADGSVTDGSAPGLDLPPERLIVASDAVSLALPACTVRVYVSGLNLDEPDRA